MLENRSVKEFVVVWAGKTPKSEALGVVKIGKKKLPHILSEFAERKTSDIIIIVSRHFSPIPENNVKKGKVAIFW